MQLKHFSPPEVRPPFGRYHQAVAASGTERLLFVSGQLGIRSDGTVPNAIEAQAEQAFANIEACLAAGGFTRRDVVRLTVFLTELEYRHGYMQARDAWVVDPPPASTLIIVKALALPACKVEIEAIAAA